MKELSLSVEEEFHLDEKYTLAQRKLTYGGGVGGCIVFILMMIPQKYLPVRGSNFSNQSMLESGGWLVLAFLAVLGCILLLAFMADHRYMGLRKDIQEKVKVTGVAKSLEVKKSAIDEESEAKRTLLITDMAPPFKKLYWLEGNLYGFNEGDSIQFECGKHSQVLFSITKQ
jgi:hypothetical protein